MRDPLRLQVPRRVDRRLQELEREMLRGEQERRPEQREAAPDGLQEVLTAHPCITHTFLIFIYEKA